MGAFGLGLGLGLGSRRGGGVAWTPLDLYEPGDILLWYDPSDLSTLFQDAAGTTPVTADGQSVALIRDNGPGGYHRTQSLGPSMAKYKTDGVIHRLLYDGTDDFDQTGAINWGTDEIAACVGLTKASNAAAGTVFEFGITVNNATFGLFAPTLTSGEFQFNSRGTVLAAPRSGVFSAPVTKVLTVMGEISADTAILRVDGVQVAATVTDQGTGNYGNHIMTFGRRQTGATPLNGSEYQTVIRNRLFSTDELARIEAFIAAKAGLTL